MNFFNIGPMELLLILTVVLIVFGPDKIPDIAGTIGKQLRQFRQASKEISEEFDLEDLKSASIMDALEAKAVADERAEKAKEAEGDDDADAKAPPALPASVASDSDSDAEETEADVDADVVEEEAPKRRFHLPPVGTEETPADDADSTPDAESLTIDYESPEDAD